jgi:alpha-L-fucosidase
LEAWDENDWKEFTNGTTIGYKRLLRFPDITARKIRLRIDQSRLCPTISNFGLFEQPPIKDVLSAK